MYFGWLTKKIDYNIVWLDHVDIKKQVHLKYGIKQPINESCRKFDFLILVELCPFDIFFSSITALLNICIQIWQQDQSLLFKPYIFFPRKWFLPWGIFRYIAFHIFKPFTKILIFDFFSGYFQISWYIFFVDFEWEIEPN